MHIHKPSPMRVAEGPREGHCRSRSCTCAVFLDAEKVEPLRARDPQAPKNNALLPEGYKPPPFSFEVIDPRGDVLSVRGSTASGGTSLDGTHYILTLKGPTGRSTKVSVRMPVDNAEALARSILEQIAAKKAKAQAVAGG